LQDLAWAVFVESESGVTLNFLRSISPCLEAAKAVSTSTPTGTLSLRTLSIPYTVLYNIKWLWMNANVEMQMQMQLFVFEVSRSPQIAGPSHLDVVGGSHASSK